MELPDEFVQTVGAEGYDKGRALVKVTNVHEQIIDIMLRRPRIQQTEIAEMFGYTKGWVCRFINSDAFQARLAERRNELLDAGTARRVKARVESVTIQALDVVSRRLDATDSAEVALEALGISTKALATNSKK